MQLRHTLCNNSVSARDKVARPFAGESRLVDFYLALNGDHAAVNVIVKFALRHCLRATSVSRLSVETTEGC